MINAQIVGHSKSPQGDELITVLCTFPRIILAEVNTHRMLSKNTSSSRAIPFNKMLEAIQNNPFIPIAWQKDHKGMQGTEYLIELQSIQNDAAWLRARDFAVEQAQELNGLEVTKQLCNRLLEPFMWTTMLITGSREGWDNFFRLRCPSYTFNGIDLSGTFKSKKDSIKASEKGSISNQLLLNYGELDWLKVNKGQAEIHIMDLAEKIWDAVNESTPKQLKAGEWHIPFQDKINHKDLCDKLPSIIETGDLDTMYYAANKAKIEISVAMAARTSYTVVGEEKALDYEAMIALHDRLLTQDPPHSSPFEHTARAMSDDEYYSYVKGEITVGRENGNSIYNHEYYPIMDGNINPHNGNKYGWCYNLKGFIPYRYLVDNKINL